MTKQELEKELEEILNVRWFYPEGYKVIKDVIALIDKHTKVLIGKQKRYKRSVRFITNDHWYVKGYNQALKDIRVKLEK